MNRLESRVERLEAGMVGGDESPVDDGPVFTAEEQAAWDELLMDEFRRKFPRDRPPNPEYEKMTPAEQSAEFRRILAEGEKEQNDPVLQAARRAERKARREEFIRDYRAGKGV